VLALVPGREVVDHVSGWVLVKGTEEEKAMVWPTSSPVYFSSKFGSVDPRDRENEQ